MAVRLLMVRFLLKLGVLFGFHLLPISLLHGSKNLLKGNGDMPGLGDILPQPPWDGPPWPKFLSERKLKIGVRRRTGVAWLYHQDTSPRELKRLGVRPATESEVGKYYELKPLFEARQIEKIQLAGPEGA